MVTFLGQAETKAIAFWSPEHQYVFWRSHLHPLCVSSCLLLLYESWILVIFALICFQKHYFYLLFYVFGLPFSMAPPRRDSLHHIFLLPCRNSAEAFHPATVQVISYENYETWPIWILTQFVKPTLDTSNLFLSSVPRIMIAKAATNSWKLSLPSPEESNLGDYLTSIWHRFHSHGMLKSLSSKHTKHVFRQERVVWQPSKLDEVNLDAAWCFRQMQR